MNWEFSSDGPISSGCYMQVDFGVVEALPAQQTDEEFLRSCGIAAQAEPKGETT